MKAERKLYDELKEEARKYFESDFMKFIEVSYTEDPLGNLCAKLELEDKAMGFSFMEQLMRRLNKLLEGKYFEISEIRREKTEPAEQSYSQSVSQTWGGVIQ